jgi:hypothetical protein
MRPTLLLRHFGVDDAAAGRHPLGAATLEFATMAEMIFVQHVAHQHVGHGFEATMRMSGKAGEIVVGIVRGKLVQHEEWIDAL